MFLTEFTSPYNIFIVVFLTEFTSLYSLNPQRGWHTSKLWSYSLLLANTHNRIARNVFTYSYKSLVSSVYKPMAYKFSVLVSPGFVSSQSKHRTKTNTQSTILPHWKKWFRHIQRYAACMTHTPSLHFPRTETRSGKRFCMK